MENQKFQCDYCDAILASQYNLTQHQKASVKCLKLQNGVIGKYACSVCKKNLSSKKNLEKHMTGCQNSLLYKELSDCKEIIKDQEIKIKNYEKDYLNIREELVKKNMYIIKLEKTIIDFEKNKIPKKTNKHRSIERVEKESPIKRESPNIHFTDKKGRKHVVNVFNYPSEKIKQIIEDAENDSD
jgi:hypothetical protein